MLAIPCRQRDYLIWTTTESLAQPPTEFWKPVVSRPSNKVQISKWNLKIIILCGLIHHILTRTSSMFPTSKSTHLREGISIIEVLTSIVVAMIGVFGVMILIPFAVKQAKTGLDRMPPRLSPATRSQFEIYELPVIEIQGHFNTGSSTGSNRGSL